MAEERGRRFEGAVLPSWEELPPAFVHRGFHAGGVISAWGDGVKPADEALQDTVAQMSGKDLEEYEERLRAFFSLYQGPGGP